MAKMFFLTAKIGQRHAGKRTLVGGRTKKAGKASRYAGKIDMARCLCPRCMRFKIIARCKD